MVHTRINERSTNPNPYINFISALPSRSRDATNDSEATELMRALAAQLKPVMKAHGFTVNSFEEYESNRVFLGRNWNNGETVELVLRDASGLFYPISMLLSVFCHELAHIKHMNHSTAFHTLRRKLSAEVATLQRKGYYGDGYWSAGTRLADSQRVLGDSQSVQELPEYTCGGAHAQSRSSVLPSRRRHGHARVRGPSLSTGAQTTKRRKAGSRVTAKAAFEAAGGGSVLDEGVEKGGKGSGFGKQAGSRRAREERALAAERRLLQMQGKFVPGSQPATPQVEEDSADSGNEEDGFDERCAPESDWERLKMMRDLMGGDDLGALRDEDEDDDDIVLVSDAGGTFTDPSEMKGTRPKKGDANEQQTAGPSRIRQSPSLTYTGAADISSSHGSSHQRPTLDWSQLHANGDESRSKSGEKRRLGRKPGPTHGRDGPVEGPSSGKRPRLASGAAVGTLKDSFGSETQSLTPATALGAMVDAEMRQRKREALGMDRGRKLGGRSDAAVKAASRETASRSMYGDASPDMSGNINHEWTCQRCTFVNNTEETVCAMCDGSRTWSCSKCTFENSSGGDVCQICDGTRG